ncbi:MAG: GntR family transcriptional regulator [Cypionkella sp.]|uniref:GntR family transcriptional regulator n=1 Tax=Cypionkella sp. TaxID=2811411 RepID=UPI002603F0AB|nr:GntR family transcriptional regulator [Cypionkella sp.]MDB5659410.1 GntR family transcriptional regulator [Cypionkella sp.]MDB5666327.1 GntR family transcriptional regulator [Cypionkella sp.]
MVLKAVDVSKTVSAGGLVFAALRRAIIEGELKDGDPLRQDEIARLFNTSRIPVREAITMLEQQGLVKNHRFKGAVVVGLSIAEASEIFDFRCIIDAHVLRAALPNMTAELIAEARAICAASATATDPMLFGDLNRAFHITLYQASNMPFHLATLTNAMDRLDRYLRAQLLITHGHSRSNAEHLEILDACERGDADAAVNLTVAHIRGAQRALHEHLGKIQTRFKAADAE